MADYRNKKKMAMRVRVDYIAIFEHNCKAKCGCKAEGGLGYVNH
jgi:hypothetical protein